ncbi:hypothetical protein [Marinilabilia salmonicolor]|jgi:hypothetical protein|uniref:Uncharacterized protein n=1 Tax=Marinilabilia salmonicolor TaxID=989 RepID=A0A368UVB9_9BACT|nr:hypothetical protein [Marinilabilia salmonicolor]RCW32025.1 hypothetical protein DFO77_11692 [Marinilabilia salmonicolor]
MMNISRDNYEVWFIDYLDGNLDREALAKLQEFLQANPDLEKELKDFSEVSLSPDKVEYESIQSLYKEESDLIAVSRPDYLLIKQMEQGLTEEENIELTEEIRNDESLIKRGLEYQQTRLVAADISYQQKGVLIRRSIAPWYRTTRIAAAVIVVALLLTIWNSDSFFAPERQETVLELLPSLPATIETEDFSPDFSVSEKLAASNNGLDREEAQQTTATLGEPEIETIPVNAIAVPEKDLTRLQPSALEEGLAIQVPNAYEAGLRHMMPMYLDINRNNPPILAEQASQTVSKPEGNFLMKGIQFVDRVSGDLVNFDKLYDEDGNFIAYNLKAGYLEVEKKLRR